MKITLQKNSLVSVLGQVADIIPSRATMPVLECVSLKAKGNLVSFRSTNLDLEISCSIAAHVAVEGEVLIKARKALSIIKQLSSEELVVSYDGVSNRCVIDAGSSRYQLATIKAEEFPKGTEVLGSAASVQCKQKALKYGLSVVQSCASSDENRYILNSCLLDASDGHCKLVATDGRRLACVELELENSDKVERRTILPLPLVKKLGSVLEVGEKTDICITERQVKVSIQTSEDNKAGFVGDIVIVSKLVEGKYPNYKQVIPNHQDFSQIEINREDLLRSVNRVALMLDDKVQGGVRFDTKDKFMNISAGNSALGHSEEEVELAQAAPGMTVAFNPIFFKEMLGCLGSNSVILKIKDEISPIVLNSGHKGYIGILMPLRLS